MTSRIVIRFEGYPDEVVIPGVAVEGDVALASIEAEVATVSATVNIDGPTVLAEVSVLDVTVDSEVISIDALMTTWSIVGEWEGILIDGVQAYEGHGPPPVGLGEPGDYYLDLDSGVLWEVL